MEAAAAKTGWSVQQVLDFLGKDLPNVSYVSAGSNMTFDKGSLQSFSQSELNSILSNPKVDPGLKGYISSKAYGNLYKLSQGVSWKYNNAFTDTKSGKSVDLKVTVQGLGLDYSGRYGLPPMIMVGEKYIGSDVAGIGAVKYGLTFLEHGTNTPINITSLIGVGDVDAKQSVAVYNATSALRGSENKNYSGDDYLGSINTNGIDDFSEGKNTQYQSWFLVPNSSTISYVFSAADPAWGNVAPDGSGFMGFYHQNLGGIPLPIKNTPPTPPTVKYNHTNVALEKPTPTEVTYHYDTIMPATIPGGTPISYHYNEISVPIPNPTKVDKNEKGVNIDGKNVLPGSVNNYELTMDLSKFKGIKVTDQDLAKGFYFVDDYPEKALDVDPQTFTSKTVDGKTVKGLSAKIYQSLSEVPSDVAAVLKANNITPKGAFVLISADDPAQFFKDYVETGTNITVNAPMKVKAGFAGKYENKAWQLTFGQGEATDIVSNNVPKIDPKKDIVISADNRTSLNNHTIELGQNFDYLLKGGILDKDQGHDIYEYKWIDDYDQNHDQYNGQFIAPLTVDVALKDGTVLKAGTDISNHVSQNIDTKTGSVEFSVDKDFLDKVDFDKGGFAADILMSVKKIKAGEVDNTYTNIINGQKFGSNTVHSTTPEPKTPETPATPQTPTTTPSASVTTPQTPATPQPVKMVTSTPSKAPESPALPQMGETNDTLAEEVVGFAAIVAVLGMAGTSLKKRKD
ncbi:SspB-related isopeptide-forming adhesin [Ligilactobacillus salivarius]|uniref:SspB-related isopeptide-forming adhesin n=1 Tax=Ligilactobacillus salivarius TaxID=1624 RepID=UPI00237D8AAD|nr:SspB-related isopeptide-forming adhesin [Ligilactobacillus salivarius]MDE1523679.1 LPXTG cell wall anchor domain-containing protein [Ligilactobacillus salivarius]